MLVPRAATSAPRAGRRGWSGAATAGWPSRRGSSGRWTPPGTLPASGADMSHYVTLLRHVARQVRAVRHEPGRRPLPAQGQQPQLRGLLHQVRGRDDGYSRG